MKITRPNSVRRRLLRHYLPLAVASTAALVLSLNAGFLDANRYPPPSDIFTEGAEGALPDGDYPPAMGASSEHDRPTPAEEPADTSPASIPTDGHTEAPAGGHGRADWGEAPPPQPGALPAEVAADVDHEGDQDSALRMRRYATVTGYVATVALALTLLIGPANLLLRRRNPVSSYVRRDIGIWTAVTSAVHVVFGFLAEHGDGQPLGYFFEPGERSRPLDNSFGLANWTGLAALLIVAGLAAISSDLALRTLKARRWKRLQRLNYVLFALVILHAVFYGALWRPSSPYTVLLGIALVAVMVAQAVGIRLWRRSHGPAASTDRRVDGAEPATGTAGYEATADLRKLRR